MYSTVYSGTGRRLWLLVCLPGFVSEATDRESIGVVLGLLIAFDNNLLPAFIGVGDDDRPLPGRERLDTFGFGVSSSEDNVRSIGQLEDPRRRNAGAMEMSEWAAASYGGSVLVNFVGESNAS